MTKKSNKFIICFARIIFQYTWNCENIAIFVDSNFVRLFDQILISCAGN